MLEITKLFPLLAALGCAVCAETVEVVEPVVCCVLVVVVVVDAVVVLMPAASQSQSLRTSRIIKPTWKIQHPFMLRSIPDERVQLHTLYIIWKPFQNVSWLTFKYKAKFIKCIKGHSLMRQAVEAGRSAEQLLKGDKLELGLSRLQETQQS